MTPRQLIVILECLSLSLYSIFTFSVRSVIVSSLGLNSLAVSIVANSTPQKDVKKKWNISHDKISLKSQWTSRKNVSAGGRTDDSSFLQFTSRERNETETRKIIKHNGWRTSYEVVARSWLIAFLIKIHGKLSAHTHASNVYRWQCRGAMGVDSTASRWVCTYECMKTKDVAIYHALDSIERIQKTSARQIFTFSLSHCFSSRRSGTFYLLFICEDEWMCYNLDSEYARHGVWIHWTMSSTMCIRGPWRSDEAIATAETWRRELRSTLEVFVCVCVGERMRKFCVKLFIKHLEQH